MSDLPDLGGLDLDESLHFDCPRCAKATEARFYGPCGDCRTELRTQQGSDGRDDVAAAEYEPKMNVTPNAVATKD